MLYVWHIYACMYVDEWFFFHLVSSIAVFLIGHSELQASCLCLVHSEGDFDFFLLELSLPASQSNNGALCNFKSMLVVKSVSYLCEQHYYCNHCCDYNCCI